MEVVAAPPRPAGGTTPFRDHDVREWSRLDTITGALERARLETDSWSAATSDTCHRYGKVVDSRARTGADGSLQAQASRQLEVFQSRAAGARLQVVKTKTVSSSTWSGKSEASPIKWLGFEDLQLPLNPLDLSSQKSKASVARTVHRRPPTRHPRVQNSTTSTFPNDLHDSLRSAHFTVATNLHRVSRLCHQIHESAVRNAFGRRSPTSSRRGSGDGSATSASGVEITEIESNNSDSNSHSNLARTESNSSDDVHQVPEKDSISVKVVKDSHGWRRDSKIRRSLQFPKVSSPTEERDPITPDLPEGAVNVKRLRDELEKGRRLSAALRNNSISADLNALDNIIQSISSASSLERSSVDDNLDDISEREEALLKPLKKKRESFVTVESLQEVKGRLRRTSNSPASDIYKNGGIKPKEDDDSDDGIVTEEFKTPETITNANPIRVKSYVYGMESSSMLHNKKSMLGTGSLESRSKFTNGTSNHKNEDWYNRRKSYGFEKVHGPEEPASISLKNKKLVESSTDSGICRSSEIMVVPTTQTKTNTTNETNGGSNSSDSESDVENKYNSFNKSLNGIHYGNVKKMTSIFNQEEKSPYDEMAKAWSKRPASFKENDWKKNEIKSTTITIPIVKNNNVVDLSWNDEPEKETKGQPTSVDEKYPSSNGIDRFRKTSSVSNDLFLTDDDNLSNNRKAKKVEFCKTEVHFAAESGKVNIVETDEKPPPTQNFRRRRIRNSSPIRDYPEDFNKNGLPMLHFGDSSYEKTMFGVLNDEEVETINNEDATPSAFSIVTVNNLNNHAEYSEDERRDFLNDNDNLKGILKNKPLKPKPYHLGETAQMPLPISNSDEDTRKWGVRLRHVPTEAPIWKSTVTVHNSYQNEEAITPNNDHQQPTEFQKLLRNLRPTTTKKPDYLSDNENRYSDSFANIRVVSAAKDNRRSSWSVADRVKLVDEIQESKGYSTKVNFGDGKATVVQNDQSTWPRMENPSKDNSQRLKPTVDSPITTTTTTTTTRPTATYNKYSIHSSGSKFSPVVLRKTVPIKQSTEPEGLAKSEATASSKPLNSPSLVNRKFESSIIISPRQSPTREISRNLPPAKYVNESVVLRQPRKSEMTYFGVGVSPKISREVVQTAVIKKEQKQPQQHLQKPDLLQHHKRSPSPSHRVLKPRRPTPESDRRSPIYENLRPLNSNSRPTIKSKYSANKDFDSSILDELTKAADQILQAVNGYTSEDCQNRLSSEEEESRKPLDTISETKSWKNSSHDLEIKNQQRMRPTLASAAKMKVKRTSSTSSVESVSKDRRKPASSIERRSTTVPTTKPVVTEKSTKKIPATESTSGSSKASTKARRLQRASSREALLQSHGSSSEDLPAHVEAPPARKPRLIKKTKAAQLTITSGIELKRPVTRRRSREEKVDSSKSEARIMGSLPEMRYKTALSTITSTTEKCSRDRSKTRNDESKAKMSHSRRDNSIKGTISSSSTRPTTTTTTNTTAPSANRGQQQHQHQSQRATSLSKEPGGGGGVTQHRISTANIKRCHRSENASRH